MSWRWGYLRLNGITELAHPVIRGRLSPGRRLGPEEADTTAGLEGKELRQEVGNIADPAGHLKPQAMEGQHRAVGHQPHLGGEFRFFAHSAVRSNRSSTARRNEWARRRMRFSPTPMQTPSLVCAMATWAATAACRLAQARSIGASGCSSSCGS